MHREREKKSVREKKKTKILYLKRACAVLASFFFIK